MDSAESRRRREESGTSVRKNKREEGLAKRRQLAEVPEAASNALAPGATAADGNFVAGASTETAIVPAKKYSAADVPALAAGTQSSDPAVVLQSVKGLRRFVSTIDVPLS